MARNAAHSTTPLGDLLAAQPANVVAAICAPSHHSELSGSDVVEVAELLGIDFATAPFSVEDLQLGMELELELGYECWPSMVDAADGDDIVGAGLAAAAHLQDRSDYYTRLTQPHAPGDPTPTRFEHGDVGAD